MSFYYYGINEKELDILLKEKVLKLPKKYLNTISLFTLCQNLTQAISQSTQNIYLNKAEKIVILKLSFNEEVSSHFYLRSKKEIKLENVVGYYIGYKIDKSNVYSLEAGILLSLEYENILSDDFINSLVCADEEDIYQHINIKGIDLIDINTIMDKSKLDKFIEETFNLLKKDNNYNYIEVS